MKIAMTDEQIRHWEIFSDALKIVNKYFIYGKNY